MNEEKKWNLELSEYIKQGEPGKKEKAKNWETAIGLQDVDGLKPSKYLIETAKEHIEGNIDIEEAKKRINRYYKESQNRNESESSEEADKVSVRITEILSENTFNFSPTELMNIHKRLFVGIYKSAGQYRDYNFTKDEWILNDDTVIYSSYEVIKAALDYDFEQEKQFSYKDLDLNESLKHLCRFISNIWQVHPFCEGNTRTTAVFLIKYLRTFGFNVNDAVFADNSWYFRNALVRANYKDIQNGVFEDRAFLIKFLRNLLLNENNPLNNRELHINAVVKGKNISKEARIITMIRNNPNIKSDEMALHLNVSVRTVKNIIATLKNDGKIVRINGKKYGYWKVI
jgi:fido (protein-threonine AMPylation protein)